MPLHVTCIPPANERGTRTYSRGVPRQRTEWRRSNLCWSLRTEVENDSFTALCSVVQHITTLLVGEKGEQQDSADSNQI